MNIVLLQNIHKLRKSRRYINARLIFDADITLMKRFFNNESKILLFLFVFRFAEVHKDRDKRSLSVCGEQRYNLILDGLNAALDLLAQTILGDTVNLFGIIGDLKLFDLVHDCFADLIAAHLNKGRKMSKRNALSAVLIGGDLRDDLCCYVAGGGTALIKSLKVLGDKVVTSMYGTTT